MTPEELQVFYSLVNQMKRLIGRALKRENAFASIAKAKANGSKLGRKKIRNDKRIRSLRAQGFTIRQIARLEKVSTGAVQRGLKCGDALIAELGRTAPKQPDPCKHDWVENSVGMPMGMSDGQTCRKCGDGRI